MKIFKNVLQFIKDVIGWMIFIPIFITYAICVNKFPNARFTNWLRSKK